MNMYAAFLCLFGIVFALCCCASEASPLEKVCGSLSFPEGPAWDGHGSLYFSQCNLPAISVVDASGEFTIDWTAGGHKCWDKTNGMTFTKDGSLFVCDHGLNVILKVVAGKSCDVYADNCEGEKFKGPNDLAFDPGGNLYFTDPVGSTLANPIGCLFRVEKKTRKVSKVADGMAFPNGLAFTKDAKSLFVCESQKNRILKFDVKKDGSLGVPQQFADLSPAGKGEPDGMAVDRDGNLWVAHFGNHKVLCVSPEGKIIGTIAVPHENDWGPTNVEFGGKDYKTLYITDAGSCAVFKTTVKVAGLRLFSAP